MAGALYLKADTEVVHVVYGKVVCQRMMHAWMVYGRSWITSMA